MTNSLKLNRTTEPTVKIEQLYQLIECDCIQLVYLSDGRLMVIDEEGKLKANPVFNKRATMIAHVNGSITKQDCITGHALICKNSELR